MESSSLKKHEMLVGALKKSLTGNTRKIRIRKRTVSNLFRYEGRKRANAREVDLSDFDQPLHLDAQQQTLDVQGLATYETILDYTLAQGFVPTVAPGFKHLTIGGAIVGVGIESTCFRYGFVHDGLLEAEVLLPDGSVVVCSPTNEHSDLFFGLGNSYGTLGYILRAKIRVRKATPYVYLSTKRFSDSGSLLDAMKSAAEDTGVDYIESAVYSESESYLTIGYDTEEPKKVISIYGDTIFYKEISRPSELYLTAKEYAFRYDPDWFWGLPEGGIFNLFRKLAPPSIRNSRTYKRYFTFFTSLGRTFPFLKTEDPTKEMLIQDWEVPWKHAKTLLDFVLEKVDLDGKPWLLTPIKSPSRMTNYPTSSDTLYLNVGTYTYEKKEPGAEPYYHTKLIDKFCFEHEGIKMLYSSSFMDEATFNRVYNGAQYATLKAKYDPKRLAPTLYEKAVSAVE